MTYKGRVVMNYKVISGNSIFMYKSFASATNKLVKLGVGKLYYGRVLVGEL